MADLRPKRIEEFIQPFRVEPGRRVRLPRDFDPAGTRKQSKAEAREILAAVVDLLADYQTRLAAQDTYGLLVVFQAMDAAGKDGTIGHVMSGVNPQGVQVSSFKVPSSEDLDHDYLWRYAKKLPERGNIGIFNRSYYEEVLVVRVHPQILAGQKLPPSSKRRRHLEPPLPRDQRLGALPHRPGLPHRQALPQRQQGGATPPVPRPHRRAGQELEVQRQRREGARLLGRLPEGVRDVLSKTSTAWAPWYVIPADDKPFARVAAAGVLAHTLIEIDPTFPKVSQGGARALQAAKVELEGRGAAGSRARPDRDRDGGRRPRARRPPRRRPGKGRSHDFAAPARQPDPHRPRRPSPAWHALSPDAALRQQEVTIDGGLTLGRGRRAAGQGRREHVRPRPRRRRACSCSSRQYADPMQLVLLVAGIICLFLPGQFYTGVFLHPAHGLQRVDGHEPGGQGGGERFGPVRA